MRRSEGNDEFAGTLFDEAQGWKNNAKGEK